MKQQRISGKEAVQVAEDMAKPGPICMVDPSESQEAPGALVPSPGSELDRKTPPRVRKPLPLAGVKYIRSRLEGTYLWNERYRYGNFPVGETWS